MRRKSFENMNCSIAQTLEVIGEWWTMLIVRDCLLGVRRFDEFHERLGVSRNILSDRLEHLVKHGVLIRVPYQKRPPRHEYHLTEKGRELWSIVVAMRQWGDRWEAPSGPPVMLEHISCGQPVEVVPTCSTCGDALSLSTLRVVPGPGSQCRPAAELAGDPPPEAADPLEIPA